MFPFSTLALPLSQTFACDKPSSLGMIVHLSHHTFLHNPTVTIFFCFTLGKSVMQQKRNISFWLPTFPCFFTSPMYLESENLPLPWLSQQAHPKSFASYKHHYCSKFLDTCSLFFGQHISLVINKSNKIISAKAVSCSRGFTVTKTDLLKLSLYGHAESEKKKKKKKNTPIHFP